MSEMLPPDENDEFEMTSNEENSEMKKKHSDQDVCKDRWQMYHVGDWMQHFVGYWNWPPSKWGPGQNKDLIKEGKSPLEIWDSYTDDVLKNHKTMKEYHETVLNEYEKSKENGQTINFWEKYWKDTYNTKLPNPENMEERWKTWKNNGYAKDKFWEEERKKFKKENGWSFWKRRRAECQELPGSTESRSSFGRNTCRFRRRCSGGFRSKEEGLSPDEKPLFKMFDF